MLEFTFQMPVEESVMLPLKVLAPFTVIVPAPFFVRVVAAIPVVPTVTVPAPCVTPVPEKPFRLDVPPVNEAVVPPETAPTPDINVPPVTDSAPVRATLPVSVRVPPFHVSVENPAVYVDAPAHVPDVPVKELVDKKLSPCVSVPTLSTASTIKGFSHVRVPEVSVLFERPSYVYAPVVPDKAIPETSFMLLKNDTAVEPKAHVGVFVTLVQS